MIIRLSALAVLGAACLFTASHARGTTFCVDSAAEIAAALAIAEANGEDDAIRIVAGNYPLDETLRLGNSETESFALSLSGRWNADCTEPSAAGASTLSGRNERQILALSLGGGSDVTISDLAFVSGFAAFGASGGVLDIAGGRDVLLDRIQVYGNVVENGAAPLEIRTGGPDAVLTLRNSLLLHNLARGQTGARIASSQGAANVVGNTITANASSTSCPCSALNYAGTSAWTVSNNLVWGNEGGDVFINPLNAIHRHNDIGALAGGSQSPGAGSGGDISVDPQFAEDGAHVLPSSPLANAGVDDAPGGIGDLDGGRDQRRVGARVDIGAFETDVLFRHGFDPAP